MMKRQAYKHLLTKARTWSRTYLSGAHIKMPNSSLSAIWHFAYSLSAKAARCAARYGKDAAEKSREKPLP